MVDVRGEERLPLWHQVDAVAWLRHVHPHHPGIREYVCGCRLNLLWNLGRATSQVSPVSLVTCTMVG
jgi:hypothetical protein